MTTPPITKILLVDDEPDLQDLVRKRFRRQIQAGQYEFVFALSGGQALALLERRDDIDLVLTDINMPGMDGLTLLTRLAELNPLIRTVIVTAYGDSANIRTAMNRGAFDFITKPIDFTDLETTINKTKQLVEQLRETVALKAVDEMKTRFFVNITHELRTPLSLIISPVDKLLEATDLPAPYQQPLDVVRRNARHLLRLINQLLDISKLEARQMDLINEVGDLPGFVGQLVELFRPSAAIKHLALLYQSALPQAYYTFDAGKWEKILYNLLANAIKFTPDGTITVELLPTATGVRLIVGDTGIGIAAEQLPRVFDRFFQVETAWTRTYAGTGIGLSLVRELTERMGGSIRVESQPATGTGPSGTRFLLDLPLTPVQIVGEAPAVSTPTLVDEISVRLTGDEVQSAIPANDDQPLVLVVEDNDELRDFIVAELATAYRVRAAVNGLTGWQIARTELPAVVVSDLMMPELDGFGLLERLRTDPATDHIPLLLLTATTDQTTRLQGLTHGADDYLTKPFHLGELLLRLRNLLQRQQWLREQYRQQLMAPESPVPPSVDNQFLQRVYTLLEQHLDDTTLSVEWLADQLAMSRKTLYLKIQSLTQLTPVQLIRHYRLQKALVLLRQGRPVAETAYLVGFDSPSYFTKVFREVYQQTPTDYISR